LARYRVGLHGGPDEVFDEAHLLHRVCGVDGVVELVADALKPLRVGPKATAQRWKELQRSTVLQQRRDAEHPAGDA
jgi:hypothetical protein